MNSFHSFIHSFRDSAIIPPNPSGQLQGLQDNQVNGLAEQINTNALHPGQVPSDQPTSDAIQNITDYLKGSENNGLPGKET